MAGVLSDSVLESIIRSRKELKEREGNSFTGPKGQRLSVDRTPDVIHGNVDKDALPINEMFSETNSNPLDKFIKKRDVIGVDTPSNEIYKIAKTKKEIEDLDSIMAKLQPTVDPVDPIDLDNLAEAREYREDVRDSAQYDREAADNHLQQILAGPRLNTVGEVPGASVEEISSLTQRPLENVKAMAPAEEAGRSPDSTIESIDLDSLEPIDLDNLEDFNPPTEEEYQEPSLFNDIVTGTGELIKDTAVGLGDAAIGGFQGATADFGDEIVAGGMAALGALDPTQDKDSTFASRYEKAHDKTQELVDESYERSPVFNMAGTILGGLGTLLVSGGSSAALKGASLGTKAAKSAMLGAAGGAAYSAGQSKEDILTKDGVDREAIEKVAGDMAIGAASGAVLGAAGEGLAHLGSKQVGKAKNWIMDWWEEVQDKNHVAATLAEDFRQGSLGHKIDPASVHDDFINGVESTAKAIRMQGDELVGRLVTLDDALSKEVGEVLMKPNPIKNGLNKWSTKGGKAGLLTEDILNESTDDVLNTLSHHIDDVTPMTGAASSSTKEFLGELSNLRTELDATGGILTPERLKEIHNNFNKNIIPNLVGESKVKAVKFNRNIRSLLSENVEGFKEAMEAQHLYRTNVLETILNNGQSNLKYSRKYSDLTNPHQELRSSFYDNLVTGMISKSKGDRSLDIGGQIGDSLESLMQQPNFMAKQGRKGSQSRIKRAFMGDKSEINIDDLYGSGDNSANLVRDFKKDISDLAVTDNAMVSTGTASALDPAQNTTVGAVKNIIGKGAQFVHKQTNRAGLRDYINKASPEELVEKGLNKAQGSLPSTRIYNYFKDLPSEAHLGMAKALQERGGKIGQSIGKSLEKGVMNKDISTLQKNLFIIMQNPELRKIVNEQDFEEKGWVE